MKKTTRRDAGIDYVRLLSDHAQKRGISEYSDDAIREFGDELQRSLTASTRENDRVRGLRAEALFGTLVAAIGAVRILKAEDSGTMYFSGDDVSAPDYRIVTLDGKQLLVEVKVERDGTVHSLFKLSHNYVARLRAYASCTGAELRIAIFWERIGLWTLNRLDAFEPGAPNEKQWRIGFVRAFATNEMIELGDYFIATACPLRFRVLVDPNRSDPMPANANGTYKVTLAGVQLLSQDRVLSGFAAQLAWKLLWYGTWDEVEQECKRDDDDRLLWVDHVCAPSGWDEQDGAASSGLQQIGFLSQLISRAYLQGARKTIHTIAKGGVLQPGYMADFIPKGFVSDIPELPLAVCRVEPNFDFRSARSNLDAG